MSKQKSSRAKRTYPPNQTLRILINRPIIRELQFIMQHIDIHIRMIIGPERRLPITGQHTHPLNTSKKEDTYDPSQHLKQHRPEAPPVNLIAIGHALNNLRRKILRRPAERSCRIRLLPDRLPGPPHLHPRTPRSRSHPRRHGRHARGAPTQESALARARGRGGRGQGVGAPRELLGQPEVREDDVAVPTDEDVLGFEIAVDDARGVEGFYALYDFGGVEPCAVAS